MQSPIKVQTDWPHCVKYSKWKPKISSTHHHLTQQASAFDSNALRKQTGKHPQQGGAIKPDRLATIRRESIEEQIHPGLPNPRCSPPTQTSSARQSIVFFLSKSKCINRILYG